MTSINRVGGVRFIEQYKYILNKCRNCWYHAGYCDKFPEGTNPDKVNWFIIPERTCINCALKFHNFKKGFGYIRENGKSREITSAEELFALIQSGNKYIKFDATKLKTVLQSKRLCKLRKNA